MGRAKIWCPRMGVLVYVLPQADSETRIPVQVTNLWGRGMPGESGEVILHKKGGQESMCQQTSYHYK